MKRLILLYLAFLLAACGAEKSVNSGKPTTFVKYFNGGNSDFAQAVSQTPDGGYIILAYSQLKPTDLSIPHYKIKLIKTDPYGNEIWQQLYPAYEADTVGLKGTPKHHYISYQAHSLAILPSGGYVLVGEDIQTDQTSRLLVLTVGADGTQPVKMTYPSTSFINLGPGTSVSGEAVTLNSNGNFLVLSSVDTTTNNLAVAEIDKDDLSLVWSQTHGAGATSLANKLFLDGSSNLIASGTLTKDNPSTSKVRFFQSPQNSQSVVADESIGDPQYNEQGADICEGALGFAITGTTSQFGNAILFNLLDRTGALVGSSTFVTELINKTATPIAGSGNAITATKDGQFVILGTITGTTSSDYCLMKVDGSGAVVWKKIYGGKFTDAGVSVLQCSDGGYVALGTTQLAGIPSVMLMKTDLNGEIQ